MHWIERLNDPLAPDREGAIRYMRGEIERALPEGWALRSDEGRDLTWRIERTSPPPENGIDRDYLVELTADLRRVIFTWGNRPAGPFDLHFCLL